VYAVPLQNRPKYQGFFGAVFGISSVAGPLVGGAFTTNVTWRWCFYINLPLGAVVMVFIFFLLHIPDRPSTKLPIKDKLQQLNALGLVFLFPGVVCLCLALQWGGTTYAVSSGIHLFQQLQITDYSQWSEGRIIVLLAIALLLLITFVAIQVWKPEQAMLPARIFLQRSIACSFWVSACIGAHMMLVGKWTVL
jgi:MFS family permease